MAHFFVESAVAVRSSLPPLRGRVREGGSTPPAGPSHARQNRTWLRYLLNLGLFTLMLGTVTTAALLVLFSYRSAELYTHPNRVAPSRTPAQVGLTYQDARLLTEDGLHLAAWYVPGRNGAAVIMLHGIGSNRGEHLTLARDLNSRGYGALLMDLRAYGESEGEVSTVGVREVRDIAAAVDYLRQQPGVESNRIVLYGRSLGAVVGIQAAARIPEIRAVVADSSFSSVEWLVHNQFSGVVNLPSWTSSLVLYFAERQTGIDPATISPVRDVGRISPRPLLIVHGENDRMFNVENAHLLDDAAREPKELWIVPGVGHAGASSRDPSAYVDRLDRFFAAALALDP